MNTKDGQEALQIDGDICSLLPAWFTTRMTQDVWTFGLEMVTGGVLVIRSINQVTQAADGSIWLEVDMLEQHDYFHQAHGGIGDLRFAPTSRTVASVNASHVVWAFELAST